MGEFQAWPKIPRLNRNCIVTEKIDGTNAAVLIEEVAPGAPAHDHELIRIDPDLSDPREYAVFAQSRKRLLQVNENGDNGRDNFGFAAWVKENALELAAVLGPGRHFGEWWGRGIQRGYDQEGKRFSLFNSGRWHDAEANGLGADPCPSCCSVVPVVAMGTVTEAPWLDAMTLLAENGSQAAPGFDNPEGIIVYHTAARSNFKVTFEQDDLPKSVAAKATPPVEAEPLQPDRVFDAKAGATVGA